MRGALGNSLLLYLIIAFVIIIIVFFSSVLIYSKAYRAKNRIVEVIEKYGYYPENNDADRSIEEEIVNSLGAMGYQLGDCKKSNGVIQNKSGYKYCIEKKSSNEGTFYKVTTYVEFYFPLINELFDPEVTSETKILNKNYDY
jgi:hypothetical protein